jgi:hypothetical protein
MKPVLVITKKLNQLTISTKMKICKCCAWDGGNLIEDNGFCIECDRFIQSEIETAKQEERQRIISEVEGMKFQNVYTGDTKIGLPYHYQNQNIGFNEALNQAIEHIKGKKFNTDELTRCYCICHGDNTRSLCGHCQ